jgi:hypothetical protein
LNTKSSYYHAKANRTGADLASVSFYSTLVLQLCQGKSAEWTKCITNGTICLIVVATITAARPLQAQALLLTKNYLAVLFTRFLVNPNLSVFNESGAYIND